MKCSSMTKATSGVAAFAVSAVLACGCLVPAAPAHAITAAEKEAEAQGALNQLHAMQSTLEENTTLETRVAELEKIVQDLRDELSITQTNLENAQSSLQQMQEDIQNDHRTITAQDLLRELQVAYTDGRLDEARSIATLMQDMNLVSMLPSQSLHSNPDGSEAAAPADVFEEIVQALQSEE